jgi:hypothetical protein
MIGIGAPDDKDGVGVGLRGPFKVGFINEVKSRDQ